jgi:N utilization substance protein A
MAITEFNAALNQVATERGIPVESVLESIKMALLTAYKKDRKEAGEDVVIEEFTADLDEHTGEVKILKDGKDVTPAGFGRIAAQTAKQVILQKIRETEKEVVVSEFKSKVGEIVIGTVFRMENGVVVMDLGKNRTQGIMPQNEQVQSETYRLNQKVKVLVKDIRSNPGRGTEIIVSRSDAQFVVKLFEQEVPEIASGTVVIEAIAREAGSRTKIAVSSKDEKVDPVGSCVGQKGVRVQSIISELFGEKIDIVPFSIITEKFIASSLAPARVTEVDLDKKENRAIVTVPEDQQSLAIGKDGQNARLANKLTKWKIDIKGVAGAVIANEQDKVVEGAVDKSKVVGIWDAEIKKKSDKVKADKEEADAAGDDQVDTEVAPENAE